MEWFVIKNSIGKDVGNVYPQTDGMAPGYDLKKANSVHNIPNAKFPDFEPDLSYFVLDKKAKLTDVISTGLISAGGFIINDKVRKIFDQFNLPIHKYYPARILYKKSLYNNYQWMHFGNDSSEWIDFSKSEFQIMHPLPFFREETYTITANSAAEVSSEKKKYSSDYELFPRQIVFKPQFNLDLILLNMTWHKYYVNKNIIDDLSKNNITGFEYLPSNAIFL